VSFLFSWRFLGVAFLAIVAGCAGPGPEELPQSSVADASETYSDAETVAVAWPERGVPYQEFAETLGIAAAPSYHSESMAATKASVSSVTPKIVTPRRPLQCVPYARMVSGIALRGDARTWWESAAGRFRRGQDPEPGAVLVLKGSSKTPRGHVGVVTKVVNEREILIDHANWLNNRKIHLATPVIDVSPENDWSAIRVWYTPGAQYGANVYPTDGFIYAGNPSVFVTVSDANVRARPTTRSARIALLPRESKVEILGKIPGSPWYRVAHSGSQIGFVHAKLVAQTPWHAVARRARNATSLP
jgi:surface antigen